jgi:hypothetical protein
MAFLFKSKQKSPAELVKFVREGIQRLNELLGPYPSLSAAIASLQPAPAATPTSVNASPATASSSFSVDRKALDKVHHSFA